MTHNILDTINAMPNPRLSRDELDTLIAAAQRGDNKATLVVLRAQITVLKTEINHSLRLITRNGFGRVTDELFDDVTADALQVFLRVLMAFDPDRAGRSHFGGILKASLRRDERMNSVVNRVREFRVPFAVATRRSAAIKEAGGDIEAARLLVKKHGISLETFDAITRAYDVGISMNNEDGPAVLFGHTEAGYVRIDDLRDTERALSSLDFISRMIVESSFGLNGQSEQSNAEIGANLGLSRWAVQRRLEAAILTMRSEMTEEETDSE